LWSSSRSGGIVYGTANLQIDIGLDAKPNDIGRDCANPLAIESVASEDPNISSNSTG